MAESPSIDPDVTRLVAVFEGAGALAEMLQSGEVSKATHEVRQEVKSVLDLLVEELPRRLSRVLPGGVDVQGVKPDYILGGLLHVHLDEARYSLTVAGTRLPVAPWRQVEQALATALTELKTMEFTPEQFLASLLEAYQKLIQEMGKPVGSVLPVERVVQALAVARQSSAWRLDPSAKNYRSYGRDHFRAQLYRLLSSTPKPTMQGLRLSLTAGSNTDRALFMFIPALGRCAYVGLVAWTSAESGT